MMKLKFEKTVTNINIGEGFVYTFEIEGKFRVPIFIHTDDINVVNIENCIIRAFKLMNEYLENVPSDNSNTQSSEVKE